MRRSFGHPPGRYILLTPQGGMDEAEECGDDEPRQHYDARCTSLVALPLDRSPLQI